MRPQKLMPPYSRYTVKSIDDIVALGSPAIEGLLEKWELELASIQRGHGHRATTPAQAHAAQEELKKLLRLAPRIPPFVRFRPFEWFHEGDEVVLFHEEFKRELGSHFIGAIVVSWNGGGHIQVRSEQELHVGEGDRHIIDWFTDTHNILQKWEHAYFCSHLDYGRRWITKGLRPTTTISQRTKRIFLEGLEPA